MKDRINIIISIDKYEAKHYFKRNLSPSIFKLRFSQSNLQFDNLYTERRPDAVIINYEEQSRYISQLAGTIRNIHNDDMTKLIIVSSTKNKIETLQNSYDVQLYLHKQLKPEKFQRRLLSCFHLAELIDKVVGSKRLKENRLKLLIAEDDEKIVKIYDKFLSGIAFDTQFAGDGTDALIKYDQWKPDIILLDILLPKMPGLEVLKEIRKIRKDKNSTIIMATSQGSEETVKTCLQHGIQGYIIKPVDSARLNRTIIDNYIMHIIALQGKNLEPKPKAPKASKKNVSTEKDKNKSETPLKKIKVLIVDDDPKIIQLYNKCLSPKAYDIKTAINIDEGFKIYQSWSPNMIVLDILFPEMSGIELLKNIRIKCKDQKTTIVMATTQKKDAVIKECMSHNIQGYLMKPFDVKKLNQVLYKYHQKNKNI